jgi:maleamate amidohydrolase
MPDPFEDHCWRDVIPAETLALYAHYKRKVFVGPAPALLLIDLYELAYQGGARPVAEVTERHPSACGIHAWNAIAPTQRLLGAARRAGLPIFYSTADTRPEASPRALPATNRRNASFDPALFAIRPEFAPAPEDTIVTKQRASAFFGTPLTAHLTRLGVRTLIVCGESTSGCVRASVVDAYSHGYHVVLAEECCFDRSPLVHKISLFDMHHKYADVLSTDAVMAHLEGLGARAAAAPR